MSRTLCPCGNHGSSFSPPRLSILSVIWASLGPYKAPNQDYCRLDPFNLIVVKYNYSGSKEVSAHAAF